MINQELMDALVYFSLKEMYINKDLIKKIVLSIIDNSDSITQKEFNGIYFRKLNWEFSIAEVDEKNRIIANYSKMIEQAEKSTFMSYLERNLRIIGYLLHEIEHVKEESKKSQRNFEANVLKHGCGEYIYQKIYNRESKKYSTLSLIEKISDEKYKKFCENNWEFIPAERIAETNARKNILDSLTNYPEYENTFFVEYKNLTNYYISSLKMGYTNKDYTAFTFPMSRFFAALRCDNDLIRLLYKAPDISSEKKMMYGFKIEPQDVIEINKMKVKARR